MVQVYQEQDEVKGSFVLNLSQSGIQVTQKSPDVLQKIDAKHDNELIQIMTDLDLISQIKLALQANDKEKGQEIIRATCNLPKAMQT